MSTRITHRIEVRPLEGNVLPVVVTYVSDGVREVCTGMGGFDPASFSSITHAIERAYRAGRNDVQAEVQHWLGLSTIYDDEHFWRVREKKEDPTP